jgi:hypothetical protein
MHTDMLPHYQQPIQRKAAPVKTKSYDFEPMLIALFIVAVLAVGTFFIIH